MPAADGANSLEAALDELYGVDPDAFVETRKRLAGELRAAGEKDAVKAVQAARRPTTAAWALNRLSRDEPGIVEELLERSRDLRSAQTGRGGRDAMREATRAQRRALSDATEAAMALLGERATDAYRSQMLATLHAASADQTVGEQLRVGRLIREASGSTGFPEGPMLTLVPDLEAEPAPKPKPKPPATKPPAKQPPATKAPPSKQPSPKIAPPTGDTRDAAQQERAEQAKAAEQRRLERDRERERAAIEAAQRRMEEADAAARAAQEEAVTAEAAAVAAREQVAALQHDLDGARREARAVDAHAVQARREATRLEKAATRLRSRS